MKKSVRFAFAALSLFSAAAFAQAERLSLAFTSAVIGDPAACMEPSNAPAVGLLTENDVAVWTKQDARWYFDPARIAPDVGAKIVNRCFVLTIDGKEITRGIALSRFSARLVQFPTMKVSESDHVLNFQLTTGTGSSASLMHLDSLIDVLADKANLRIQMRKATPFAGFFGPGPASWRSSVETLIAADQIKPEMSMASLFALLGQPTASEDEKEGNGQILRWYFNSPMHVNPMFIASAREGLVKQFTFESR